MKIAVVDLDIGNMHSLSSALRCLGADHIITADPSVIMDATHLILPGVGSFDAAMAVMAAKNLKPVIFDFVRRQKKPLLGVCLGMQLLFQGSEEGQRDGIGLLPGRLFKLTPEPSMLLKVPHVGFSTVYGYCGKDLFQGLQPVADFYFTHSFAIDSLPLGSNIGYCDHSRSFVAAFQFGKLCGAQFHPEKSQSNGLRFLSNFIELI